MDCRGVRLPLPAVCKGRTDTMMHRCPGCGVQLPEDPRTPLPEKVTASRECWQAYSDLQCSTVALRDARFTHQHVVDAYAAQHAGEKTRGISVVFGLIGLYLALEKGFSGKEVQRAHMRIARKKRAWPDLAPPRAPGRRLCHRCAGRPRGPGA